MCLCARRFGNSAAAPDRAQAIAASGRTGTPCCAYVALVSSIAPAQVDSGKIVDRTQFALHAAAAAVIQASSSAMLFLLPIIGRKSLGASKTEMLVLTGAPTVLFIFSIFWGTLLVRTTIRRYLLIYFVIGCVPYAAAALVEDVRWVMACHLLGALGGAAWPILNGELLKRLYGDAARGKAYGLLTCAATVCGAAATLGLGEWLAYDSAAWRIYMPVLIVVQAAGLVVLAGVVARAAVDRPGQSRLATSLLTQAFEPLTHMREVLTKDRTFARYEAAFMTYGIGWMICLALVPFLVTDKLDLPYDTIASSTHLTFLITLSVMTIPAGWLMTKLGPMRMSAVSFWSYTSYPLLLMAADSPQMLMLASVFYGIASAGVNVCWMLGPVSLAGSAENVPRYVAIHATLVGFRGAIFQALGVWLYAVTGALHWPLLVGAAGFLWAGYQMWALRHQDEHAPFAVRKPADQA